MTVRVGVIGAGIMGSDHARLLSGQVSRAELTMISDPDSERLSALAATVRGVRSTDDAHSLITSDDVDAVLIASPDATHADYVRAALAVGKPTLCEKPLAPNLDEARTLCQNAEANGSDRLLSLGFMRRFDPAYVQLKAAVAGGELGAPLLMHAISRGVSSGPGSTSESSVTNSAIHEFDIVPWLLDSPITEVSWQAPRCSTEADGLQDPQVIMLRTADGVLSVVETFLNARYGYDMRCEIVAERGTAELSQPVAVIGNAERTRATGYPADWRPRFAEAYRLELQAWIDAVADDRPNPTLATARDGLLASVVADAVITSMHEGGRFVPVRALG